MKLLTLFLVLSIVSCKSDGSNENINDNKKISVENIERQHENIVNKKPLPKFKSLNEMFQASYDFSEEEGTLKLISLDKSKLHIQISKPIFKNDLKKIIEEQVKRDIVYVAFQTFAQTEINELTITSVPISSDDSNQYFNEYKKTVKISRKKALSILKEYIDTEDFSILYENQNGMWVPSKKFSVLKFEKLDYVFNTIVK